MATVLKRIKDKRLTAAQECEARMVFELAAEGSDSMNAKQLKMCLLAMGFSVAKGEAQALVYKFDYTDTATIDLADFQKIFLSKMLESSERGQLEQAFKVMARGGGDRISLRDLSSALYSSKHAHVSESDYEDDHQSEDGIDSVLLRHQMRLQYYSNEDFEAVQDYLDGADRRTEALLIPNHVLAAFLRL